MSMQAALADLAASAALGQRPGRRRVAVLGDMLELGPDERAFHATLGRQARDAGVDVLVAVGPLAAETAAAFGGAGERRVVSTAAEAAALVPRLIAPGDVVLVKASRGVGLEAVCRALSAAESSC
jgi:UDP-N-acetylmuramyl pentapeptide synthase